MSEKELQRAALQLPRSDREKLVAVLLESLPDTGISENAEGSQRKCTKDKLQEQWHKGGLKVVVDEKTRIVVPDAQPGDVFSCETAGGNRYVLTKLEEPQAGRGLSREEVLRAVDGWKTKTSQTWEELRALTREA